MTTYGNLREFSRYQSGDFLCQPPALHSHSRGERVLARQMTALHWQILSRGFQDIKTEKSILSRVTIMWGLSTPFRLSASINFRSINKCFMTFFNKRNRASDEARSEVSHCSIDLIIPSLTRASSRISTAGRTKKQPQNARANGDVDDCFSFLSQNFNPTNINYSTAEASETQQISSLWCFIRLFGCESK